MDQRKYASGRWQVKQGREAEFIERWTTWLTWTKDVVPGFRSATLLRSDDDPDRFTSFSVWDDAAAARDWKMTPGFAERLSPVRELCQESIGGDFAVAAHLEGAKSQ